MAGKQRYTRTITELFTLYPDYAMIVISAEDGITEKTKEQFESVIVLNIPFFFIVNKMDLVNKEQKDKLKL